MATTVFAVGRSTVSRDVLVASSCTQARAYRDDSKGATGCTPQPHLRGILGAYIDGNGSQRITMSKGVNSTAQDEQQQEQLSGG